MIAYKFAIPATQNPSTIPQNSPKTNFSINFSSKSFVRIKSFKDRALTVLFSLASAKVQQRFVLAKSFEEKF